MKDEHVVHTGEALEVLAGMEDGSVHCCVTSPPYWNLRDYGPGGQLGLEDTPEEYVDRLTAIFGEVRRVLRKDGTLWVVIGDTYAASGGFNSEGATSIGLAGDSVRPAGGRRPPSNLKPKDLVGIPWRVGLALQRDGWWLRQANIWHKPNAMPESVQDRTTMAHEYILHLSRAERYYYDNHAIREPIESGPSDRRKMEEGRDRIGGLHRELDDELNAASKHSRIGRKRAVGDPRAGRNRRSVWSIASQPYPGPHFAVYPPSLVAVCVRAGTSDAGCCAECGAPLERVLGDPVPAPGQPAGNQERRLSTGMDGQPVNDHIGFSIPWSPTARRTVGWERTCGCDTEATVPCTVLDPFCGSGTTGLVAQLLGRSSVQVDMNPEYADLARCRMGHDPAAELAMAARESDEDQPLLPFGEMTPAREVSR